MVVWLIWVPLGECWLLSRVAPHPGVLFGSVVEADPDKTRCFLNQSVMLLQTPYFNKVTLVFLAIGLGLCPIEYYSFKKVATSDQGGPRKEARCNGGCCGGSGCNGCRRFCDKLITDKLTVYST